MLKLDVILASQADKATKIVFTKTFAFMYRWGRRRDSDYKGRIMKHPCCVAYSLRESSSFVMVMRIILRQLLEVVFVSIIISKSKINLYEEILRVSSHLNVMHIHLYRKLYHLHFISHNNNYNQMHNIVNSISNQILLIFTIFIFF